MTSWIGRKYQQNIYLTKDLYPKYIAIYILIRKRMDISTEKCAIGLRRQFPNEKIQIANKHEKMSNFVSPQENTK